MAQKGFREVLNTGQELHKSSEERFAEALNSRFEKDAEHKSHSHTIQLNDFSIQVLKDEQKQASLSHAEEMAKLNA